MNRRKTLKLLSLIPVLASLPIVIEAKQASKTKPKSQPLIDEKDTLAKAMQYRHEASKAPAMRTNKKAFCYNCSKYNVCMDGDKACKPLDAKALKAANQAPCQIFKGKDVAKNGWCLSWQAKS